MANSNWEQTVARIRELVLAGDLSGISDGSLLRLFVTERDEAAFEAIVRRHAPMIMGVCRRVLQNPSDADDAFQATFLILVRKAASLAEPELLANWLYSVAFRTARTARDATRRRRAKEGQVSGREAENNSTDYLDLIPVLDAELHRLPAKYRAPIVLCDLEQKSRKEVAGLLGLPEGTLASRLARARSMLSTRLSRRGVTLSGAALAMALGETCTATSPALVQITVKAGLLLATGKAGSSSLTSSTAFQLSETAMKTMLLNKLKTIGVLLVASVLVTACAGTLIAQHGRRGAEEAGAAPAIGQQTQPDRNRAASSLFEPLLKVSSEIADSPAKVKLLLRIAQAQVKEGDFSGAKVTADKVVRIAGNWPSSSEKVSALVQAAILQDTAGQKENSRTTAKLALQASLGFAKRVGLDDKRTPRSSVSEVAQLLAGWVEYEDCLKLARAHEELSGDIVAGMAHGVEAGQKTEMLAKESLKRGAEIARKNLRKDSVETSSPSSPSQLALEGIAAAYVRLGDLEAASRIDDFLKAIPWRFHSNMMPSALPSIASEQVKVGDFQGALTTISKLDCKPDLAEFRKQRLLRSIVERELKTDDLPGAVKTAVELTNRQQRANVLLAIAAAQLKKGDRRGALARLDEIRKLNEPVPTNEKKPAVASVNAPVIGAVQAELEAMLGDFEGAGKTAANLTAAKDKAEAFCAIAAQYLAAKKLDEARSTLHRASESAERISSESRRTRGRNVPRTSRERTLLLRRIAELQARSGDAEGALKTVESLPPGDFLNGLVLARAEGGDFKGAIGWLGILKNQDDKSMALEQLAGMMTKAGDESAALKLAGEQSEPLLKAYTLLGIALAKAK